MTILMTAVALAANGCSDSNQTDQPDSASAATRTVDIGDDPSTKHRLPTPDLSPGDVVRTQLEALQKPGEAAINVCYGFASPRNRELFGSAERFSKVFEEPPFSQLREARDFLLGEPTELPDGRVQVLVTVIGENDAHSYAWILARQKSEKYLGCWMTDSVVPIEKRSKTESI